MKNIIPLMGFLMALLLTPHAMAGADTMPEVTVTDPARSYGVQIGDVLSRHLSFTLPANSQLAKDSLPAKGSRQDGIELVSVQMQQDGKQGYVLQLQYQVFATHSTPVAMQLPELSLKYQAADGQEHVLAIPAWKFWFAPLVSSNAARLGKAAVNMQNQFRPPLVDMREMRYWLLVFAGLVVAGALALLYINADRKWLPFMGGAFAEAHRRIKRLKPSSPQAVQEAFYHLHTAFNTWHGNNCFAQDIDSFVQKNPRFGRSRAAIDRFFASSNEHLFLEQGQDTAETIKELKQISKQLRHCERGVA
ncbi:mxaA protein [Methylobacillus rhizosphaerae]|uniref:MxaA protein n=1 Tax=Methylobacillus rhizosphaerae TaxID=551994 RepID=A0A239AG88_9PROT|nr:hypothetical protein [Methylobacillus rhizosphaerae]SNR94362.1 mxaA protein [Methylobacillus rhizosphaerae]